MKKVILGMLFAISFSFACDAPYEDIQGIKIGCEFTGGGTFKKIDGEALSENFYRSTEDVKFFDAIEVETDKDDKAVGIAFIKEYDVTMSNMSIQERKAIEDFKQFTESLEKRWGGFDKTEAKEIFSRFRLDGAFFMKDIEEKAINKDPGSDALGMIALFLGFQANDMAMIQGKPQSARLILAYFGKSTAEELQKEKDSVTDGF